MKLRSTFYAFFIILLSTQAVLTSEKWMPLSLFAQNSWMKNHTWHAPSFQNVNSQDFAIYTTIAVASAATLYGIYRWMQPTEQSRITPSQAKKFPQKKPVVMYQNRTESSTQTTNQLMQSISTSRDNQTEYLQQDPVALKKQNDDLINRNKELHELLTSKRLKLMRASNIITKQLYIIRMQEKALNIDNTPASFDSIRSSL